MIPAQVDPAIYDEAMALAVRAHQALGCRGVSRADLRYDGRQLYMLEVNTQPGMTPTSLVPEAAYVGIGFSDLVAWMVENAVRRMKLRPAIARRCAPASHGRGLCRWRNGRALAAVCAIFFATLCGVVWLSWQAGIPQRAAADAAYSLIECSAKLGFVVRDVFVVGRPGDQATLLNAVSRGTPILAVDLEAARRRIQTLPWVRHATVRRVLPDTVVVEIIERRPLAIWQHEKKFALIDEEGKVILRNDVGAFSYLMIVVGEDAVRGIGARANAGNRTGPRRRVKRGGAGWRTSLERAFRAGHRRQAAGG